MEGTIGYWGTYGVHLFVETASRRIVSVIVLDIFALRVFGHKFEMFGFSASFSCSELHGCETSCRKQQQHCCHVRSVRRLLPEKLHMLLGFVEEAM